MILTQEEMKAHGGTALAVLRILQKKILKEGTKVKATNPSSDLEGRKKRRIPSTQSSQAESCNKSSFEVEKLGKEVAHA